MYGFRPRAKLGVLSLPLAREPDPELGRVILKTYPKYAMRLEAMRRLCEQQAKETTELLNKVIDRLVERARRQGINVTPRSAACGRAECSLCLGFMKLHYPYFLVVEGGRQRQVRKDELWDFLHRFLSEEELKVFLTLRRLRDLFLHIERNLERVMDGLGLSQASAGPEASPLGELSPEEAIYEGASKQAAPSPKGGGISSPKEILEEGDLADLVAQQVAAEFGGGGGGGGEDGGGDFAKQLASGILGALAGTVLKHPKVREALRRWLKEED
jgi:hypothetical protein